MTSESAVQKRRKELKQTGYRTEKQVDAAAQKKVGKVSIPKNKKLFIGVGGLLLIILLMMFACGPSQGTMMYGMCGTFLELHVRYPTTLKHSYVEQYPAAVRIGYTHVDGYGQLTLNMIECKFRQDPKTGMAIEAVLLNRKELGKEKVEKFNHSIGAVVTYPPDLTLPPPLPTELVDLRQD